jgi:hypothetical protein
VGTKMRDGRLLKKRLTVVAGLQEEMFCGHTDSADDATPFLDRHVRLTSSRSSKSHSGARHSPTGLR